MPQPRKHPTPYPPPDKKYLTRGEAAAYLGIGKTTLEQWHHYGKGPRYYRIARTVAYLREDLNAFVASHAVDPVTEHRPIGRPRKQPVRAGAETVTVSRRTGAQS